MKRIPPTFARFLLTVRALIVSLTFASLLFVTLFAVHSQNPSKTPSKGESAKVLLVPNQTVNAGEVRFRRDSDHDGMTDEDEQNNGTNPQDASDADGDADGDGLSNGAEVAGGSGVNNSDSDGDGVSDGEEVSLGYNPNDPTNTPPPGSALASLEVTPGLVTISMNSMLGQEPVQLRVTGVRNDGTTMNLTGSPTLTYQSVDGGVAVVDDFGKVGGVGAGQTTVRVSSANVFADTPVLVTTFTPTQLGQINIPGYANNVDVAGNYAYVAAGSAGLVVVNVTDRNNPLIVATLDTPGNGNDVRIVGTIAYLADGASGLRIINVATPQSPVTLGTLDTPGEAYDVVVYGARAYVADGPSGVHIIDVSNPFAPTLIGSVDTPGIAKGLDVSDDFIAVADDNQASVAIIDAAIPASPQIAGRVVLGNGNSLDLEVRQRVAYVAGFDGGLRVVDFSSPSTPQIIASLQNVFIPRDVALRGRYAVAADVLFQNAVPIIDLADPSDPVYRGVVNFSGDTNGTGVAIDDEYFYMTGSQDAFSLTNGATGNTGLYIAAYQSAPNPVTDTAGIAPTVNITAPIGGQTIVAGDRLPISITATDDIQVRLVQLIVNGVVAMNDIAAPYNVTYTVPRQFTNLTIEARAYDEGGNVATSPPVTLNVIPEPAPVVYLLSPEEGSLLIEGQVIELLAHATDDGEITRIIFTVNGTALPADTEPPFKTTFTVPAGQTSLTISATATDDEGVSGTLTKTFAVTPPIATTVTGRVIDFANQPVVGANVSVFGEFFAQTAADGSFSVAGVASERGPVSASASAIVGGEQLSGTSLAVAPAPGGVTNVGNVLLRTVRYETEIGNLLTFPGPTFDDKFAAVTLPFSFSFYGVTYTQAFVGTNGYLTFGTGDTAFNETPTNFANNRPRIAGLFDDWFPDQTSARGVFVNTQLPGRVVFTWLKVEHATNRSNDDVSEEGNFQIVLFSDGRIQLGYGRVETLGGLVGISPGGTPERLLLKHSASQGHNVGSTTAPYEQFLGIGDFPFDLQNCFLTYAPNFGGYAVEYHRAPQTTVSGRVLDPNGSPAGGARVMVLNRTVVTEADGSFVLHKVPATEGPLKARAIRVAPDGQLFQSESLPAQAVINEVTPIGDLTLAARGRAFEDDWGQLVLHPNGSFPRTQLPLQFPFRFYGQSFYGTTVNRVYVNANGYLTLTTDCVKGNCNDQFGLTSAAVNDVTFAFSNTPIIAPFFSSLDPGNTGEVFVNSLPDKLVMTFVNVRRAGHSETNTFQVVLQSDGTIRFAYNGIGNKHGHVGLSVGVFWGMSQNSYSVNWSKTVIGRMPNPYPFFETLPGDFSGPTGNNFDLDRNVMVFFPNNDGSYEVIREQFIGPAPGTKVFYESPADGDLDLFFVNSDGSNRINLTNQEGEDYDATLSPNGARIAFDSYRDDPSASLEEIYVMNLDGTNKVRLTNNQADDWGPIWSPDGTKILFRSDRNGDYEIFIMNADGTGQRSLTGYSGDSSPVWSPDGTKILVTSDRDGLGGLYVMNADGSGVTHLDNTDTFGGNSDSFGAWSPDGSRIAFHSYRNFEADIFIVNADGTGLFNLTNDPSGDHVPRWSPDGTKILFQSFRDNNFELYITNVDGSGLVRLTNTPGHEVNACWSPDGTQVAFAASEDSDTSSLYVINADGTARRTLVNNGARNGLLEWKNIP